jgi:hypothetical protein
LPWPQYVIEHILVIGMHLNPWLLTEIASGDAAGDFCPALLDGILGNVNGYQPVGKQAGPLTDWPKDRPGRDR